MGRLPNELIPDPHVPQINGSQIFDRRLSTSCRVVERPDHHCGDDLVVSAAVFPPDSSQLVELIMLSQRFVLLLMLKQHLKDLYGFTDRFAWIVYIRVLDSIVSWAALLGKSEIYCIGIKIFCEISNFSKKIAPCLLQTITKTLC